MPHIAHTYATHSSHMSHICHTHVTDSSHMSHICHTHVTHSSHIAHTVSHTNLKNPPLVPKIGFWRFFDTDLKKSKSRNSQIPRFREIVRKVPGRVLYRPLFMANHFTNDRPNRGPKIAKFARTSPENQDFPKITCPKMGNFPNPETSDLAHFGHFQDFQDFPKIPTFP